MSNYFRAGLYPLFLHAPGSVQRALKVGCPVCNSKPGVACRLDEGKPVVHDARESLAFHGRKIFT
jgi:hypothetical protein